MIFGNRNLQCDRANKLLDAYLTGDLPARSSMDLEIHLNRCDDCCKELRVIERVIGAVSCMERAAPPPDLWSRVQADLQDRPAGVRPGVRSFGTLPALSPSGFRLPSWTRPLGVVAAAAGIAGAAAFWGLGTTNSSAPVPVAGSVPTRITLPQRVEAASYTQQAQQVAYFDPLADQAALAAAVSADRASGGAGNSVRFVNVSADGGGGGSSQ